MVHKARWHPEQARWSFGYLIHAPIVMKGLIVVVHPRFPLLIHVHFVDQRRRWAVKVDLMWQWKHLVLHLEFSII